MTLDLANVPAPDLIETLDYETILADKLQRLHDAVPDYQLLESDPAYKVLEIAAYDEMVLRQRVNDAARALMLAHATDNDLDNLAARYDVKRLESEDDERLRLRTQQGYHLLAAAGPAGAYKQHVMGVSADVIDVSAEHTSPGKVAVTVFAKQLVEDASAEEQSIATAVIDQTGATGSQTYIIARNDSSLLSNVQQAISAEDVVPLTDTPAIAAPTIISYDIEATLTIYNGPDPVVVENNAKQALNDYLNSIKKLGFDATRSGIIASLSVAGVQNVQLTTPAADIAISKQQLAVAISQTITVGGIDD